MTETADKFTRSKCYSFKPEDLRVATEPSDSLYDERVNLPVNEQMVLSIMAAGVIVPITIVTRDGEPWVVAGRQRVKNAIEANKRLKKAGLEPVQLKAIPRRGDASDLLSTLIIENEIRTADGPMERIRKAARLLDRCGSERRVAEAFGVSESTIANWLKLLDAPQAVQNAVEQGKIGVTAGIKLAGLDAAEAKAAVAELIQSGPKPTADRAGRIKAGRKPGAASPMRSVKEAREALNTIAAEDPRIAGIRWMLRQEA